MDEEAAKDTSQEAEIVSGGTQEKGSANLPPEDAGEPGKIKNEEGEQGESERQPEPTTEELKKALEQCQADLKGYYAQLQRTMADFENYKKRVLVEKDEWAKLAYEKLLFDLLGSLENLDLALKASQKSRSVKELRHGLELVRCQLWEALGRYGLSQIPTVGEKFDHCRHEAVSQVECDTPDGQIVEEIQCGYMMGNKVLRIAKVKVAKTKENKEVKK
jgi:molecular chaperone GrpE